METCVWCMHVLVITTSYITNYVWCILTADINECNGDNLCDHNCINQNGSYLCLCRHGFVLLSNQKSCEGTIYALTVA